MRSRHFLFACLFVLCFFKSTAQVNLQTGSGNFSLPMFNWQDDKSRLNSIVALSYSSGNGLRVSDIPSNVGQGWNLIAGGVISRMQNGEPDDQYAYEVSTSEADITKYPSGILYALSPASNGYSQTIAKYPLYSAKNQLYAQHNKVAEDKQLDYFSFQFNGKTGMFVLDPSNPGTAKSIGDTKMKISFQTDINLINQGIRTRITSFTIQDVDGLIYTFSTKGTTKVLQTNFCDEFFGNIKKQPKFKNDRVYYQSSYEVGTNEIANPFVVNNWSLTEIEDALTHRKIYFTYVVRSLNNTAGDDITINDNNKDYAIVSRKRSIEQSQALATISFPDGHTANFNYGAARTDVNGDYALSSVDILYQGRYLSKHELNTSYFILNRYGKPTTDYQKRMSRLCLLSVRKIGIDLKEDTPPYIFDYYTGSTGNEDFVPPINSVAKDIWGYFNGDNSKGFWNESIPLDAAPNQINHYNRLKGLCYLRQPLPGQIVLNAKDGYAKNGLLKQIIYPTGGTLTYEYEQNTGIINGSTVNVGGVHVSKTSSTDGGFSNGCANPIFTQYKYVNENSNLSSMWGLEMPNNRMESSTHYQPEHRRFKLKLGQLFPKCEFKYQYPGLLSKTELISQTALRNQAIFSTAMQILSVLGTVSDILKFAASETVGLSLIIDIVVELVEFALSCFGNNIRDQLTIVHYNANLNAIAPLPAQFKRVEVIENTGGIGKTVQEFTSDADYPIWVQSNPIYAPKQRFAPWAYGLPKITTVFDVSGQRIKETINYYSIQDSCSPPNQSIAGGGYQLNVGIPACYPIIKTPLNIKSAKALIVNSSSQRSIDWNDQNIYNNNYQTGSGTDMVVDVYDVYTGRVELKSTAERIYKNGSSTQYLETKTDYTYNSNYNYDVNKVVTTQSNGDAISKTIKYNSDYNTGVLATLVQNNIVSMPVSTMNSIKKNGNSNYYDLNINVTEFQQLANSDIKPLRTLEKRFTSPTFLPSYYGGPGTDISSFKITQQFSYDAAGNLTGVKDEGNRTITNIYDYADKYIVGSVINADPTTDKTAYTSFETSSFGNWALTGASAYSTSSAMTGSRSFILSSGKSFTASSLNTARPYSVSFWSTSSLTVSGGATLIKSAPQLNGFTYYEYDIAQGTSSVMVSGTGTIDELRIYPKTARMRTITYDPVIGKTSECDENNRISYYEYDYLGRLRFIKDEKRNVVKMYEYNNVSAAKQNGCPGIYYNKYISELFTKSDCPSGYIGDTVRFNIPANSYSSYFSQADADAKAEYNLLLNGQNYANANGACLFVYQSAAISQTYTSESCPPGYKGGSVTYYVPYGKYTSTISQVKADEQAAEDLEANGEFYANSPEHRVCIYNSDPEWEWPENGQSNCQNVNGVPHLFIYEKDINPNSSSYGTFKWTDVGPSEACPGGGTLFYNEIQQQYFIRNNCAPGYVGSSVLYTVPANTYSSTVSVQAANQLALNDIAANGQNNANANGTCSQTGCAYENCHALNEANNCINGQCEMGVWVWDDTYYDSQLGQWVCVYHYEYSDNSWTAAFYSYGGSPCYSN